MGTRHKHADAIIAWANGEEVEQRWYTSKIWEPCGLICNPSWDICMEYRIKPKRVKKEGWVNVYPGNFLCYFHSKAHADKSDEVEKVKRVACIRIEWEEEE